MAPMGPDMPAEHFETIKDVWEQAISILLEPPNDIAGASKQAILSNIGL